MDGEHPGKIDDLPPVPSKEVITKARIRVVLPDDVERYFSPKGSQFFHDYSTRTLEAIFSTAREVAAAEQKGIDGIKVEDHNVREAIEIVFNSKINKRIKRNGILELVKFILGATAGAAALLPDLVARTVFAMSVIIYAILIRNEK